MKSLRFARPTRNTARAFTLVELAASATLIGAVGLTIFSVLRSGTVLSSQNAGINVSSSRAREMLDQVNERARYALEQPSLINTDGTGATGTTSDGVLIKKFIGSPYVVKESGGTTGAIPATTTRFCVEYRADLPAPLPGDWILMESVTRPELEISAVSAMTNVGVTLRSQITTATAIGEAVTPASYRVGGSLYRKEAYTFVATDTTGNPRFQLRHYGRVGAGTNYATTSNFQVMADGYRRLSAQSYFASAISNGQPVTLLRALVNSSNRQEYVARNSTVSTFTTVPVQARLWTLNRN